jgi:hypothetical protein
MSKVEENIYANYQNAPSCTVYVRNDYELNLDSKQKDRIYGTTSRKGKDTDKTLYVIKFKTVYEGERGNIPNYYLSIYNSKTKEWIVEGALAYHCPEDVLDMKYRNELGKFIKTYV